MKTTRIMWDMPITIEIVDIFATEKDIDDVFQYFEHIDHIFNTYSSTSEISRINNNGINEKNYSREMKEVLELCEKTKQETKGFFDHIQNDKINPLGMVKGWAVYNASKELLNKGFKNFYIDAGGDIQAYGKNKNNDYWKVGIRNPFNRFEVVKSIYLKNNGIATSGTYIRGNHIYNPHRSGQLQNENLSLTVIGHNVFEADRFATAAFAMGKNGIYFIEKEGLEGYLIDENGIATYTSGFDHYIYDKHINTFNLNQ